MILLTRKVMLRKRCYQSPSQRLPDESLQAPPHWQWTVLALQVVLLAAAAAAAHAAWRVAVEPLDRLAAAGRRLVAPAEDLVPVRAEVGHALLARP